MSTATQWAYSINEENYTGQCDSREEAIAEGLAAAEEEGNEVFWIGQCDPFEPTGQADTVIEQLRDSAWDHAGEYADGYLDSVTPEQRAELDNFIRDWANKVDTTTFYTILKAERITVEEAKQILSTTEKANNETTH